jgi:hypothetical protein
LSVADLVRRRLDADDPWRLALVQRHAVWDEVRMARLLDSMLADYPIGSLLVCRVREASVVLVEQDGHRVARPADTATWQLLDGQQRINALITIFTRHGRFGRFLLHMTAAREPDDVVTSRRDKRTTIRYIAWRDDETVAETGDLPSRDRHLDLSGWHEWATEKGPDDLAAVLKALRANPSEVVGFLNEIDPEFADELSSDDSGMAASRFERLLGVWSEESIPVQHLELDAPTDVLQVFSRINLEGVRLDGEDVFFAAVKTLWNDAEERLDHLAAGNPLLDPVTGLRLLARLASRAARQGDILPLRVDRLNGARGQNLIGLMRQISSDGSAPVGRIHALSRVLVEESVLGYGLRSVTRELLDHVFAWAAVHSRGAEDGYLREQLPRIDGYLLGATALRYRTVFLDRFLRLGFDEALAAGVAGDPFPIERIVAAVKTRWPDGRSGRRSTLAYGTDEDALALTNANAGLFLSVVQRLPYLPPLRDPERPGRDRREVEWDHIWPQARAEMMRWRPQGARLQHHPYRGDVWSAGNLWALDRPINNRASDMLPSAKFDLLGQLPSASLPTRWPEDGYLDGRERGVLLRAQQAIESDNLGEGMDAFHEYAQARTRLIHEGALERVPLAKLVRTGAKSLERPDDPVVGDMAAALDLGEVPVEIEPVTAGTGPSPAAVPSTADVRELAGRYGVGSELDSLVAAAGDAGLAVRVFRSSVMFAPPANRTRMLFTVWPQSAGGGSFNIYRWARALADFYDTTEEGARAVLGPDGLGVLERSDVPGFVRAVGTMFAAARPRESPGGSARPLSWAEMRDIAEDYLQAVDPERRGVHYYDIFHAVAEVGPIGSTNAAAAVLSAISADGTRFSRVASGTCTWKLGVDSPDGTQRAWVFRIDRSRAPVLWSELLAGRLRQGWGWTAEHDLRTLIPRWRAGEKLTDAERSALPNRRMLTSESDGIHAGDLILIPHLPAGGRFSVVRVVGPYEFDDGAALGDYGHILPVRLLSPEDGVALDDPRVDEALRGALRHRQRLTEARGVSGSLSSLLRPSPSS